MDQVWGSIPPIGSAGLRVSKKPWPNLQVAVKGIPVQLAKEGHGIVQQELGQGRILQGPGERHGFLETQVLTTFGLGKRKHKHDQPKRGAATLRMSTHQPEEPPLAAVAKGRVFQLSGSPGLLPCVLQGDGRRASSLLEVPAGFPGTLLGEL